MGVIQGDTRSLDNGSCSRLEFALGVSIFGFTFGGLGSRYPHSKESDSLTD